MLDVKSSRRNFLQISGLALGTWGLSRPAGGARSEVVSLVADPADPVASSPSCLWALREVSQALAHHGIKAGEFASLQPAPADSLSIVASASDGNPARDLLETSAVALFDKPESLALAPFAKEQK